MKNVLLDSLLGQVYCHNSYWTLGKVIDTIIVQTLVDLLSQLCWSFNPVLLVVVRNFTDIADSLHLTYLLLDSNWISWEPWSSCSPPCGMMSTQVRHRRCDPPKYGGAQVCPVQGLVNEQRTCQQSLPSCSGNQLAWF